MTGAYWCRRCGLKLPASDFRPRDGVRRPVVADCIACELKREAAAYRRASGTIRRRVREAK